MSDQALEGKLAKVASAVERLVGWQPNTEHIEPKGGCNGVAFSVVDGGGTSDEQGREALFVKLPTGSNTPWRCQVEYTRLLGAAQLGPCLIAADDEALIQPLVVGRWMAPLSEWEKQPDDKKTPTAAGLGKQIASIHKLPIDTTMQVAPRHFNSWAKVPDWIRRDGRIADDDKEKLRDVYEFINKQDTIPKADVTFSCQLVLTHGDLHMENMLIQEDGSLLAVDLELAGLGPRRSDLAFFFWHWDWPGKGGSGRYPSLLVRESIAVAYLTASGLASTPVAVQELLLEVEWEVLRVTMCRATHSHAPNAIMLPLMRDLLVASEQEAATKMAIVQHGIMPMAKEQAVEMGLLPSEGSVHCFEKLG